MLQVLLELRQDEISADLAQGPGNIGSPGAPGTDSLETLGTGFLDTPGTSFLGTPGAEAPVPPGAGYVAPVNTGPAGD